MWFFPYPYQIQFRLKAKLNMNKKISDFNQQKK
jgi:hypothetical protein